MTVAVRPLTPSVGAHAPLVRLQIARAASEQCRQSQATQHRSLDGRTQGRSRALGLEVSEPLPRAFRHLAETLENPGSKRVLGRLAGETLAHPFHPHPTAAARQSCPGRDFRLSRPQTPRRASQNDQDASHRRRAIHIFKDRHPSSRGASGLIRVSLNRPMGNVLSRHAPTSACNSSAPFGVFLRVRCDPVHDLWQLVAGRPARRPPFRREPRRATSLDRLRPAPRERAELPRSEIPSIAREPEGPKTSRSACALGTSLNAASPAMAFATLG